MSEPRCLSRLPARVLEATLTGQRFTLEPRGCLVTGLDFSSRNITSIHIPRAALEELAAEVVAYYLDADEAAA